MTIKKIRSPTMTVIQATSFSITTEASWRSASGKIISPPINGELLAITTSFNSNDTDASLNVLTRDLISTNICLVTDWSTNKAAAIRYPRFAATSANTTTAIYQCQAEQSWTATDVPEWISRPIAGSLEFGVSAGTSADTCIVELYFSQ